MFRRRLPEHLIAPAERFADAVALLERAKASVLASVPTTRLPGRPLAETLGEFEHGLRALRAAAERWRATEVEPEWIACREAVDDALGRAERLREEAPDLAGFDALVGTIGDLLEPLDAFRQAAERFRELRR
jgi:hypothetical protein